MPFMIQYLRNLHDRVEAVDARTRVSVDKEEDAAAAATAAAAASMMDPSGMMNGPALLTNTPYNVPGQMGMGAPGGGYMGDPTMGGGGGGMGGGMGMGVGGGMGGGLGIRLRAVVTGLWRVGPHDPLHFPACLSRRKSQ